MFLFIQQTSCLQTSLHRLDKLSILLIREIYLARIHLECAAIVGAIYILGSKMEVQVAEFIAVGTIVDLFGIERLLHSTRSLSHIGHKGIAFLIGELIEVVHMLVISYKATAVIGLLLKQEKTRHTEVADFNHQIVEGLIVLAIETIFRIAVHILVVF